MCGQKRDIIDPFAQSRHRQGHAAQAVEQILAKTARLHLFHQVALRCGHHAGGRIAERIQHAHDLGLRLFGQIADLIEKNRSTTRARQNCRWAIHPLQISARGDDKGQRAPVREIMDRARDQRFTRAAFTGDQHRQIGVHHARDQPVKRLHRRRTAHQRQILARRQHRGAWPLVHRARGFGAPLQIKRARRPFHQIGQIERLGQVIIGVFFGRLDRRHDGVLRRDDDHRQARPFFGDLRQCLQPIAIGHHHIRDDQIALALFHPAHQRHQAGGGVHLTTRAR